MPSGPREHENELYDNDFYNICKQFVSKENGIMERSDIENFLSIVRLEKSTLHRPEASKSQ